MRKVVIVGIGNCMMKDDGIGVAVTKKLKKEYKQENVQVIIAETDAYYGFDHINKDDFVVMIDAMDTDALPGSIKVISLEEVFSNREEGYSQHEMNIIDLILLYYGKIEGYLIGIQANEIELGLGLSSKLEADLNQISHKVRYHIDKILEGL